MGKRYHRDQLLILSVRPWRRSAPGPASRAKRGPPRPVVRPTSRIRPVARKAPGGSFLLTQFQYSVRGYLAQVTSVERKLNRWLVKPGGRRVQLPPWGRCGCPKAGQSLSQAEAQSLSRSTAGPSWLPPRLRCFHNCWSTFRIVARAKPDERFRWMNSFASARNAIG